MEPPRLQERVHHNSHNRRGKRRRNSLVVPALMSRRRLRPFAFSDDEEEEEEQQYPRKCPRTGLLCESASSAVKEEEELSTLTEGNNRISSGQGREFGMIYDTAELPQDDEVRRPERNLDAEQQTPALRETGRVRSGSDSVDRHSRRQMMSAPSSRRTCLGGSDSGHEMHGDGCRDGTASPLRTPCRPHHLASEDGAASLPLTEWPFEVRRKKGLCRTNGDPLGMSTHLDPVLAELWDWGSDEEVNEDE